MKNKKGVKNEVMKNFLRVLLIILGIVVAFIIIRAIIITVF